MGESKRKAKRHEALLGNATRCVYCASKEPNSVEHMPPRGMFKDKDRPKGWEFACCCRCNEGTRAADAVAQMFAMMEVDGRDAWKVDRLSKLVHSVDVLAPEVLEEFAQPDGLQNVLTDINGLLRFNIQAKISGPTTMRNLHLFAEKMAMATFAQLCGRPIEMHGMIFTEWYLNQGMGQDAYHACLNMMPAFTLLQQGRKNSRGQFSLIYNTDENGLVAAVVEFHRSLSILIIATDDERYIEPFRELLSDMVAPSRPTSQIAVPGLVKVDSSAA